METGVPASPTLTPTSTRREMTNGEVDAKLVGLLPKRDTPLWGRVHQKAR